MRRAPKRQAADLRQPGLNIRGFVASIQRNAVHDGPGIRTIVFVKGCPLRCAWCAAPETQSCRPELLLYPERCLACRACVGVCPSGAVHLEEQGQLVYDRSRCTVCGKCATECPANARVLSGIETTVADVLTEVGRDYVFYRNSGGGVTVSGGEPLAQPAFTGALLRACKEADLHTALETSGHAPWDALAPILDALDLLLFDVKVMDPVRHQQLTGMGNALIVSNLERAAGRVPTIARVPIIPGLNDDLDNCRAVAELLKRISITRVDLLPYHRLGEATYGRLGRQYGLSHIPPPREDRLRQLAAEFEDRGIAVRLGG